LITFVSARALSSPTRAVGLALFWGGRVTGDAATRLDKGLDVLLEETGAPIDIDGR
jgi:hypothetical protein